MNNLRYLHAIVTPGGYLAQHTTVQQQKLCCPPRNGVIREGRGYGWLNQKVSKEICRTRDRVLEDPDISTSVVISNRLPGFEASERGSHFGNRSSGLVGITMNDVKVKLGSLLITFNWIMFSNLSF